MLDLTRRRLGEQHPETLIAMHNLATTYDRLGRFAEAEAPYTQTITAKRQGCKGERTTARF